jgi:hypothetical protein
VYRGQLIIEIYNGSEAIPEEIQQQVETLFYESEQYARAMVLYINPSRGFR